MDPSVERIIGHKKPRAEKAILRRFLQAVALLLIVGAFIATIWWSQPEAPATTPVDWVDQIELIQCLAQVSQDAIAAGDVDEAGALLDRVQDTALDLKRDLQADHADWMASQYSDQ